MLQPGNHLYGPRVIHLRLKWTFFIITKALFTGKLQLSQRLLFAQESEESHSSTSKHRHENTPPSPQHYSGLPPYFIGGIGTLVSVSLCCDTFIRCLNLNAAFSGKCGERTLHLCRAGFVLCSECCPRYSFTTVMTVVSNEMCLFNVVLGEKAEGHLKMLHAC